MDEDQRKILSNAADTIRELSFEAVQKANSGHPGLPMGCAEIGACLYGCLLNHNPANPHWRNRDRFILSAGHGSMLLYSCLHLAGFNVSLDDLKSFRQLHSKTPGHPEYGDTDGVETTTGPLGQGVGNAVGQALGMKILGTKFNTQEHKIFSNKVFCLAGDGCLMEGVSAEACSLAGHLGLDNLILIFDSNKITLDGPLEQSGSEDTAMRFKAYGFEVLEMDGNNVEEVETTLNKARENQTKPILIIAHTIIGKGSPAKQGTHKAHGSPLGPEECEATKKNLGLPEEDFYIPQPVKTFFDARKEKCQKEEEAWNELFNKWRSANPSLFDEYKAMENRKLPDDLESKLTKLEIKSPAGGRNAAQEVLQVLGQELPYLYGGSADLSGSDCTMMKDFPIIEPGKFEGRNIKYGIREFGMATAAAGIWQTDMIQPYIGTFLTFSDYMRNAIRLASLSKYHVIYQFTHDSFFLGEDGPTHQPVEHYASLRTIPNLHVIRPADSHEVKAAWFAALQYKGPTALIFCRQKLPLLAETQHHTFEDGVGKGAYIVKKETKTPDFTLLATGSEVSLAIDVAKALEKHGKAVRVVSMPCWELFEKQSESYKESVLGKDTGRRVSIEAGVSFGWHRWIGLDGIAICMEGFGASAPPSDLAEHFGFTTDAILERLLAE
ncbi:MAG: Transketolase [Chlamydiia bacterium]|nr:Transketolase [Chlamydiia bacterium]